MLRTHTFNGHKYVIRLYNDEIIDGLCDNHRGDAEPTIRIFTDLDSRTGLETCIHEAMHACNYMKSEEAVKVTAKDIARFLWRLGYRVRSHTTSGGRARNKPTK